MNLTKIPAVFIIFIGLAISSITKADEACVTPSGYYYNESLEFGIKNVMSINPLTHQTKFGLFSFLINSRVETI